jgi:hypothetical protein
VELDSKAGLNVTVELDSVEEKTIVSPLWAAAIAFRSEPAPLSWRLVTVSVLKQRG